MISGSINMAWRLFRLWMQMASRYSVAVNILNKKLWVANNGPTAWQVGKAPYHKNITRYEMGQTETQTALMAIQKL
jgi:hypothetical protein